MADAPTTRPSLLVRIRDARDERAWEQFVDLYAPLVYGFARKHGLQDADAADLTQDVLRTVAGTAGRLEYDPQRGSFRGWLFTVVRNRLRDFRAAAARRCQASGDPAAQAVLEAQPVPDADEATWQREYEWQLLHAAAEQIRDSFQPTTWQAFWQTAVEGQSPKAVAQGLGLTVAAVYLAKSRIMARLRAQVRQLEET
jgi:RNA polymerase sigma-70 factor (ECF subfamily)